MSDRIVEIYFEYTNSLNQNVLNLEQLKKLLSICSKPLKYEQLSELHIQKDTTSFWNEDYKTDPKYNNKLELYYIESHYNIVPLDRLLAMMLPIRYSITSTIKELPEYNVEENLLQKLISLESKLASFDQDMQFNTKVGVHISDLGLLSIKNVTWLEDACTEELQRMLAEGWRIIAVCPQPDSRRPDYVLGKND